HVLLRLLRKSAATPLCQSVALTDLTFANTARPISWKRSRQENCCTRRLRERIMALISFARRCVVSRGMPVLFRETIRPVTRLKQQARRSEEHTSELQSRSDLVCRL